MVATHGLLTNPNLNPAQKVVGYCALLATGAAPGRPATDRNAEFTEVTRGLIAKAAGVSPAQASAHVESFVNAGALRKRIRREHLKPEDTRRPKPGEKPKRQPPVINHLLLAPSEGANWMRTWADPRQMGPLPRPERLERSKKRTAEHRAKLIAGQCPHCRSTDVNDLDLYCRHCGKSTSIVDLPDATKGGRP
jgi:hypothetical protein